MKKGEKKPVRPGDENIKTHMREYETAHVNGSGGPPGKRKERSEKDHQALEVEKNAPRNPSRKESKKGNTKRVQHPEGRDDGRPKRPATGGLKKLEKEKAPYAVPKKSWSPTRGLPEQIDSRGGGGRQKRNAQISCVLNRITVGPFGTNKDPA